MMSFQDISDDDFVEIARFKASPNLALTVRCVELGRTKTRRVQFVFRPDVLGEIGGPRFRMAFAPRKALFRIQAAADGPYEAFKAGRGDKMILRCEIPPGLAYAEGVSEPEYYVDGIGRAILIEAPTSMLRQPPKALPAPTPAGGSSMPQIDGGSAKRDPVLAATLGLTPTFRQRFAKVALTPAEAAILELLYRHPRVSRDAIMMATAEDAAEDERDDKTCDVWISKLRSKLESLGVEITTLRGEGWCLSTGAKRFISVAIGEA
jgi:hypothetical protein